MRISRHKRRFGAKAEEPRYNANLQIKSPEVQVIDETNVNLGPMPLSKALQIAEEREYDLVEVQPKAQPPLCKLLNLGQFRYEQEKMARKKKAQAQKILVKGVRLSLRIGEHDLEVRRKKSQDFLKDGNKVQIELILRGRERNQMDLARKLMEEFAKSLNTEEIKIKIEQPLQKQGGRLTMIVVKE